MASLREVRVARLLTIRDLAQQAGVASSTIYLIEAGRSTPHLSVVRRLATGLGIQAAAVDEFRHAIEQAGRFRPSHRAARPSGIVPSGG